MMIIRKSVHNIIYVNKINTELLMMMLNELPVTDIVSFIKHGRVDKNTFMNTLFMSTDDVKQKYYLFIKSGGLD